ncbi:MAG TPA: hypothetical protein VGC06_06055 [Actinomycetes bacterium]
MLATIGLLFVGLLAMAGFTVMAQRRLHALGMLAAVGAGDQHVRLVLLANGAVVGAVAAVAGTTGGGHLGGHRHRRRRRPGRRRSPDRGNLPTNQLIVWLSPEAAADAVPQLTPTQLHNAQTRVDTIATALHAQSVLALDGALIQASRTCRAAPPTAQAANRSPRLAYRTTPW